MPDQLLSADPQAGQLLSADPSAGQVASQAPPATQPTSLRDLIAAAKNVGVGFAKAAGRSVKFVADDLPHMAGGAGVSDYIDLATGRPQGTSYQMLEQGLQPKGTAQRLGGYAETGAEVLAPVAAGVKAGAEAMSTASAASKFQNVMGAAKNFPVDVSAPGDVALRIQQLAERGGTMPQTVRKFLGRITDPTKGDLTYEEARDFASNISRLSANEYGRLTPVISREVANLRVALNQAVAKTAAAAGKGEQYAQAMNDYARAMKLRGLFDDVVTGAKKALPYVTAGGAGYWLTKQIRDFLPGE